ncbi:MAG TPA: transcriptional regulator [Solirubrobacterales bacterium]|nr:transcriptional regulator [Solirubrobacterales bacterium]
MIQTSARLLELLTLLQQRREWTGSDLAERLDVGTRTIRRDIEKLRGLGYPIDAAPGVAGGYRLGAGTKLPPLLLDDAEAVAVAVGLRSAATGSIAGIEETSIRALTKLEQILPDRLRDRVRDLGSATSTFGPDGSRIDPELLASIAVACRDSARLRFTYESRTSEVSEREVEANAIVHGGRSWYLVAYDLGRDAWRTFRIDRIRDEIEVGAASARREVPGGDAAAFVEAGVHGREGGPEAVRGSVRLSAPAAEMEKRIPSRYATVTPDGPDSCVVESTAGWSSEFLVWMALMDVQMTVIAPPEMAAKADGIRRRLAGAK